MQARLRRLRLLWPAFVAAALAWGASAPHGLDLLENPAELTPHPPTRTLLPGAGLEAAFAQGLLADARARRFWLARTSVLELWSPGGSDLELRLNLTPHHSLRGARLQIQGGGLTLGPEPIPPAGDLSLHLPAQALLPGLNRFQLRFDADPGTPPPEPRWAQINGIDVLGHPDPGDQPASVRLLHGGDSLETWIPAGEARRLRLLTRGAASPVSVLLYSADGTLLTRSDAAADHSPGASILFPVLAEPGRLILAAPPGPEVHIESLYLEPEAPSAAALPVGSGGQKPPNIIVYLVDTCRADFLGAYGAPEHRTPHMDAFARDSLVLANGFSLSPWTRTSVATLLTGHQPHRHKANTRMASMRSGLPTLAERLAPAGYHSEALITNGNVASAFGFGRGYQDFQHLVESRERLEVHIRASVVSDELLGRLDRLKDQQPFHLYVHVTDPHFPSTPPAAYVPDLEAGVRPDIARSRQSLFELATEGKLSPQDVRFLREMHGAEVASVDQAFGRLLAGLKQAGLYDGSLILLTADHGEQFLEHGGVLHGYSFYGELIRVPLLVKLPGAAQAGRVVADAVSHLDVVPTLLGLAGLPPDPGLPGTDLLGPRQVGSLASSAVPVYTYQRGHYDNEGASNGRYLLILNHRRRGWRNRDRRPFLELFDRLADPAETRSVAATSPGSVRFLLQKLEGMRRWVAANDKAAPAEGVLDPELQQTLEAVGYVD